MTEFEMNDEYDMHHELEERVISLFHQSVEAKMHAGEALAPFIADASQLIVQALLSENKILVAGNGASSAIAQILVNCLVDHFERERPGFAAYGLNTSPTTNTGFNSPDNFDELFSRQIWAMGSPGDVLVLYTTNNDVPNLVKAAESAHERDMHVLVFSGGDDGALQSILDMHDLEVRAPLDAESRIHEVHLLSTYCLCDLIDNQLFGPLEEEEY
ncbi:SIS domain-containing protein [Marinibactrum halimedae]|nr:SIS domain-containing protein [Marinibactrum halimedae]MCD9460146.1 SIS domain-containing protein [Marinibactrum halimedae]